MKFTLLILAQVALAMAEPAQVRPGLPPVQRICASFVGAALSAKYCAQGASEAAGRVIDYCNNGDANYSGERCFYAQLERAAVLGAGAAAVGSAAIYAFGFDFNMGEVNQIANQFNPGKKRDIQTLPAIQTVNPGGAFNWTNVIAPKNATLPKLTFGDVEKNLTYPFIFEHAGMMSTYVRSIFFFTLSPARWLRPIWRRVG